MRQRRPAPGRDPQFWLYPSGFWVDGDGCQAVGFFFLEIQFCFSKCKKIKIVLKTFCLILRFRIFQNSN